MPALKTLLTEFLEHLEIEKNRSPRTLINYRYYLGERFFKWLGEDKTPNAITAEAVRTYRLWLNRLVDVHGDPLKKNTQNYHLIALRSFLKYLAKRDIEALAPEKIELMKMPDREVGFLESSDIDRLLLAPIERLNMEKVKKNISARLPASVLSSLRDKAILELLFSTGLRVSELSKLKQGDVNLKKEEFTVLGKGGKSRVVFLSEQARYWLGLYLKARNDIGPYLFAAHDKRSNSERSGGKALRFKEAGLPLSARSIQRSVQKYAKVAGITKPVTPHTLRHSYATDLLHNGADIRSVQSMLGHSSITTTQIYTHITDRELKRVHKKFHGRRRKD